MILSSASLSPQTKWISFGISGTGILGVMLELQFSAVRSKFGFYLTLNFFRMVKFLDPNNQIFHEKMKFQNCIRDYSNNVLMCQRCHWNDVRASIFCSRIQNWISFDLGFVQNGRVFGLEKSIAHEQWNFPISAKIISMIFCDVK